LSSKHFGGATKDEEHHGQIHRKGMLFAAGLITGEALMGIFIADSDEPAAGTARGAGASSWRGDRSMPPRAALGTAPANRHSARRHHS
jgi:hypothetical protein